ncbi:hypothetical protein GGR54DRAFT_75694 [Hypoxylon sp. NC1633]|nr:hypothetical protein GGR54DRAFT_75694 [Hypoxylon sp. NC1633]
MANFTNNNAPEADECGLQARLMGLKVQYTFDKDCQERCLARWPHILNVQTISIDNQNSIGVIDLRTCLQAVAQCSPELAGDTEKDYTVYAFDYSEPDTPLVGQGMLSWGLHQEASGHESQEQMVTGRVTKNMLAIFGKGIRETLEVRLKLTAVSKITRNTPAPPQRASADTNASQRTSTPTPSENTEWNSFRQSNPNQGHPKSVTANLTPIAPAPARPVYSNCEVRNDMSMPTGQEPHQAPGSRPVSAGPGANARRSSTPAQAPNVPEKQRRIAEEAPAAPAPAPAKGGKPQSRPTSRASARPSTGRPRGRPRKNPLPVEGTTSGYEDGTDADDGPPRNKKRATTKIVERSNTATFGTAPESLRVAASTSGSIRNIRPISVAGEAPAGNNSQEAPRAPTPIPDHRLSSLPLGRPIAPSNLRRGSIPDPGVDRPSLPTYSFLSRSASYNQDAHSPADSVGVSPSQLYSDGPSPAEIDIGSSPPVPRSALYNMRSSPAPSSPILPPMPIPSLLPDSGYMSGGLDDGRVEEGSTDKAPVEVATKAPAVAKPKPKPKPKPNRTKKVPAGQTDFIIHTETPGPPELLPQTSLYNPPTYNRKTGESAETPVVSEPASLPTVREAPSKMADQIGAEEQPVEMIPSPVTQWDDSSLQLPMMNQFTDDQYQQSLDSLGLASFVSTGDDSSRRDDPLQSTEAATNPTELPSLPQLHQEPCVEPELPMVPASDPIISQLTLLAPPSEPAHPQTDAIGPADGKSNKNFVKRQTIRQKLEEAVAQGQLPSFCRNCGALQTPTWRKIWKQQRPGVPEYYEYSEKPGRVTAINILERDSNDRPILHEVIKKSLGPNDNKFSWTEILLCNPCGIWFSKFKQHRPAEKWEKDEQRLSQTRKKRTTNTTAGAPRGKRARTKSDAQTNLTSEAFLPTDPLGPLDGSLSPKEMIAELSGQTQQHSEIVGSNSGKDSEAAYVEPNGQGSTHLRGSTHSRGSGTPGSPIAVDDNLGPTRRLLFPSPRKDGELKILGEVAVNVVQTSPEFNDNDKGEHEAEKENNRLATDTGDLLDDDDFADLFGTPPRPSTPPPKADSGGAFKTPTRPTPSHRPVTRSVTRSMRSARSINSPGQILMMDRTPTRTSGVVKRHSPNDLLPSQLLDQQTFDTPMSRSISKLQAAVNRFVYPSPGFFQLDMNSLPPMETIDDPGAFDFGDLLSTDVDMLSSSPRLSRNGRRNANPGPPMTYHDPNIKQWLEENPGAIHGGRYRGRKH